MLALRVVCKIILSVFLLLDCCQASVALSSPEYYHQEICMPFYQIQCRDILPGFFKMAYLDLAKRMSYESIQGHYEQDLMLCAMQHYNVGDPLIIEGSSMLNNLRSLAQQYQNTYLNHPKLEKFSPELKEFAAASVLEVATYENFCDAYQMDSAPDQDASKIMQAICYVAESNHFLAEFSNCVPTMPIVDFSKLPPLPTAVQRVYDKIKQIAPETNLDKDLFQISFEIVKKRSTNSVEQWNESQSFEMQKVYSLMHPLLAGEFRTEPSKKAFLSILYTLAQKSDFAGKSLSGHTQEGCLVRSAVRLFVRDMIETSTDISMKDSPAAQLTRDLHVLEEDTKSENQEMFKYYADCFNTVPELIAVFWRDISSE